MRQVLLTRVWGRHAGWPIAIAVRAKRLRAGSIDGPPHDVPTWSLTVNTMPDKMRTGGGAEGWANITELNTLFGACQDYVHLRSTELKLTRRQSIRTLVKLCRLTDAQTTDESRYRTTAVHAEMIALIRVLARRGLPPAVTVARLAKRITAGIPGRCSATPGYVGALDTDGRHIQPPYRIAMAQMPLLQASRRSFRAISWANAVQLVRTTSRRYGGQHAAEDGGALRTMLQLPGPQPVRGVSR